MSWSLWNLFSILWIEDRGRCTERFNHDVTQGKLVSDSSEAEKMRQAEENPQEREMIENT